MTVNQAQWSNRHDGQTQYDSTIGEEGKKNYQRPEEFTQLSLSHKCQVEFSALV